MRTRPLQILKDADEAESTVLGAFPYTDNIAYLHTDKTLMPKRKSIWSSWNYLSAQDNGSLCVTYWMNKLQPFIGEDQDVFVTLNPPQPPKDASIIKTVQYAHPHYTRHAAQGWQDLKTIQGVKNTWFCGAWCGYGFHEDGASAGLAVAEALGGQLRPWTVQEKSPAGHHCRPVPVVKNSYAA